MTISTIKAILYVVRTKRRTNEQTKEYTLNEEKYALSKYTEKKITRNDKLAAKFLRDACDWFKF